MGLSGGSKQTTTSEPWKAAQPYILGAAGNIQNAYNQNSGKIQGYADQIGGLIPSMLQKYQAGNPAVNAAQGWVTSTLGQTGGNPFLQQMIDQTGQDTARGINANLGTRGLTGGSVSQGILARELAKNAMGYRYADYNNQNALKAQAAGMAPSLAAADTIQIAPLLSAAQAASGLPIDAATQSAAGLGGLLGQYGTQTTKQSGGGLGGLLGGLLSTGAMVAMGASDRRLKEDVRRIGTTDAGLPVYTFRYKGQPETVMGVMAQDVAEMQPGAMGPDFHGFGTVNYAEVR